ncbi:MAG TPA: cytochrome C [Hyphomicrobiales bacterium]|nr:cytochrome C [Hyphomicrobiales bacterium]
MRFAHLLLLRLDRVTIDRAAELGRDPSFSRILLGIIALFSIAASLLISTSPAPALPSYARQTGQPCATCHTAFPELTPYGRQFKLGGYTAGGTRCGDLGLTGYLNGGLKDQQVALPEPQIPLSVMVEPYTFTHVKSKIAQPDNNNYSTVQQTSVFVGGQLYCDVGAFAQITYDRPGVAFGWDLTDIRYAKTGTVAGTNITYGITANNAPTVQDVWNSTPIWSFPYISSEIAPSPAASTMIQGTWAGRVGGVGGYVWINNMVYAEFTAYRALDPRTLTTLGADPTDGTPRFADAAPYWRIAVEKTWDKHSLEVGTFGMFAKMQPTGGNPAIPSALTYPSKIYDPFTDVGVDMQYQYIGTTHAFTVRASYIWEHQKLKAESNPALNGGAPVANPTDDLYAFNASASYIYDHTISITGGYFATWGTSDALLYSSLASGSSPNSNGWVADIAFLPFSHGGPDLWPWFNGRIGVTYTHYDEFDGVKPKASRNDTAFFYTWFAF